RGILGGGAVGTRGPAPLVVGPRAMLCWRTVEHGCGTSRSPLSDPKAVHAFELTVLMAASAGPLNTVFGIVCALAIVRKRFPGEGLVNAFVDLPLALSPVVVGLSLFLLYGRGGWFYGFFAGHGVQILFA